MARTVNHGHERRPDSPFDLRKRVLTCWAEPPLQGGGHRFDSGRVHPRFRWSSTTSADDLANCRPDWSKNGVSRCPSQGVGMPAISIQPRPDRKSKPWTVRYADGLRHRSKSFRTKAEAKVFAGQLQTDQAAGEWISPDAGRLPLGQWAAEWLAAYVGRAASTQARARSALRAHILPRRAVPEGGHPLRRRADWSTRSSPPAARLAHRILTVRAQPLALLLMHAEDFAAHPRQGLRAGADRSRLWPVSGIPSRSAIDRVDSRLNPAGHVSVSVVVGKPAPGGEHHAIPR
jgi:hypothetical protein